MTIFNGNSFCGLLLLVLTYYDKNSVSVSALTTTRRTYRYKSNDYDIVGGSKRSRRKRRSLVSNLSSSSFQQNDHTDNKPLIYIDNGNKRKIRMLKHNNIKTSKTMHPKGKKGGGKKGGKMMDTNKDDRFVVRYDDTNDGLDLNPPIIPNVGQIIATHSPSSTSTNVPAVAATTTSPSRSSPTLVTTTVSSPFVTTISPNIQPSTSPTQTPNYYTNLHPPTAPTTTITTTPPTIKEQTSSPPTPTSIPTATTTTTTTLLTDENQNIVRNRNNNPILQPSSDPPPTTITSVCMVNKQTGLYGIGSSTNIQQINFPYKVEIVQNDINNIDNIIMSEVLSYKIDEAIANSILPIIMNRYGNNGNAKCKSQSIEPGIDIKQVSTNGLTRNRQRSRRRRKLLSESTIQGVSIMPYDIIVDSFSCQSNIFSDTTNNCFIVNGSLSLYYANNDDTIISNNTAIREEIENLVLNMIEINMNDNLDIRIVNVTYINSDDVVNDTTDTDINENLASQYGSNDYGNHDIYNNNNQSLPWQGWLIVSLGLFALALIVILGLVAIVRFGIAYRNS